MTLTYDAEDLAPLVRAVVAEVLAQREADEATLSGKLALKEPEAAALLSIPRHVLGDMRRRGEVSAVRAGKCYLYARSELLRFLGGAGRDRGRQ